MKVRDIMFKDLFKIAHDASVVDAAKMLKTHNIGSILITKKNSVVGFLTTKDIVCRVIAVGKNVEETELEEIMSSPVIMVDANTEIEEAAELLNQYKIKRLVVQDRNKLVGVISTSKIGANLKKIVQK